MLRRATSILQRSLAAVATPRFLLLGSVLLAALAAAGFLGVPFKYRLAPSRMSPEQGHAYSVPLRLPWPVVVVSDSVRATQASSTELFEDARPLGPPHMDHASIRSVGRGRFSHWREALYFSTSDNSDPRTNARQYTADLRLQLASNALVSALLVLGVFSLRYRRQAVGWVRAMSRYRARPGVPPASAAQLLLLLLGLSTLAAVSQAAYYASKDIEILSTKHYLDWVFSFNYGGYGDELVDTGSSYALVQREAASNRENARRFLHNDFIQYTSIGHVASFDRLATPFLSSLLSRASFGAIDLRRSFLVFNTLLWIMVLLLAASISWRLWKSRPAALGTLVVLGSYSVFPMLLTSMKVQHAGAFYLSAGIFLFLSFLDKPPPFWLRMLSYSALLFLGFFFSGGILHLVLFLGAWLVTHRDRATLKELATIAGAFALAFVCLKLTDRVYDFRFASEAYHVDEILKDTYSYVSQAVSGGDLSKERFLNYPGTIFWTELIPGYAHAIFWLNPILISAAVLAASIVPGGWKLAFVSLCLLGAHAGNFLTGWTYYYGYNTTPSIVLISVLVGAGLARMLESGRWILQILALALGVSVTAYYARDLVTHERYQFNRYYGASGSVIYHYPHSVYAYHDEHQTVY